MLCPDNTYKPLGFYSAHLNETQKKYSTFKKELLGAHKALRHFLPEVYGKHVTIYTDNLPLQQAFHSNNIPLNDPQVYRQITEIGRFTRDVRHVSGVDNVFADYLSRIKEEEKGEAYADQIDEEILYHPAELATTESMTFQLSLEALADLQETDPEVKLIRAGDRPKNTSFSDQVMDGKLIICEDSSSSPRPYVPKDLRTQIMTSLHNVDHPGIDSSVRRIAEEFYWPSLKHDVKAFVKKCTSCNRAKSNKKLVNTGEFRVPDRRFSHVMVDIVGPLPDSYGHKYILTAICRTTRFLRCIPLREATSEAAASGFLHQWLSLFGVPSVVTSDNGASFTANLWKDIMSKLHIEVKYSALYRPQSIGILERQHRSIKDSLKAAIEDLTEKHKERWLDFLPFIVLAKNSTLQQDIMTSPSELSFGTTVKIPGQLLRDPVEMSEDQLQDLLHQTKRATAENVFQTSSHRTTKYEKVLPDIPEGVTHVYVRQHKTASLQSPFEGPFLVVDRPSKSTVKIEVGTLKSGEKRYEIRHLNDLKIPHPDSLAAPIQRSKLGRPSKHGNEQVSVPKPPQQEVNKPAEEPQVTRKIQSPVPLARENSNTQTGPPPVPAFPSRQQRTTRNQNPRYIDAIWSASHADIRELNQRINAQAA